MTTHTIRPSEIVERPKPVNLRDKVEGWYAPYEVSKYDNEGKECLTQRLEELLI